MYIRTRTILEAAGITDYAVIRLIENSLRDQFNLGYVKGYVDGGDDERNKPSS